MRASRETTCVCAEFFGMYGAFKLVFACPAWPFNHACLLCDLGLRCRKPPYLRNCIRQEDSLEAGDSSARRSELLLGTGLRVPFLGGCRAGTKAALPGGLFSIWHILASFPRGFRGVSHVIKLAHLLSVCSKGFLQVRLLAARAVPGMDETPWPRGPVAGS